MKDVLYVLGMGCNLLSIIALDRKGFEIRFRDQGVRIIDISTNEVVVKGGVWDGLYQLTELVLKKVFVFDEAEPYKFLEATKDRKNMNIFRRIHKRLGYLGAYRLKNLHLFAEGVEVVISLAHFQCDVCDQSKMSQTINHEAISKAIRPGV